MKDQTNKYLQTACVKGLSEGVAVGMAAGVHQAGKERNCEYLYFGGLTRSDKYGEPIDHATVFDLASLTKPLCTTLCVLDLVQKGMLRLDENLGSILNTDLPFEKKGISVRQILSHSSGLPAYVPYFKEFKPVFTPENKGNLLSRILKEPLVYDADTECRYSDLGFIVLGMIVEQRTGLQLHKYFSKYIADPLGLRDDLFFISPNESYNKNTTFAATEYCPWRNRLLQGEVHDEHCWLMGGVAGHAGLFGTLHGVMRLCTTLLTMWQDRVEPSLFRNHEILLEALTSKHQHGSWCLGFDTPTPGSSSSGRYFSPNSVGHLGFSGTSFWIDPLKDIVVVLLTNRVHPSRTNEKIRVFRPFFHDYLMEHLFLKDKKNPATK